MIKNDDNSKNKNDGEKSNKCTCHQNKKKVKFITHKERMSKKWHVE